MTTKAEQRIKNYDDSTLLENENLDAQELRGEVSIRSNDAKDQRGFAFEPLRDDYPTARRVCECKGKDRCMNCGGKGFYFEMKTRQIYVAEEGWV